MLWNLIKNGDAEEELEHWETSSVSTSTTYGIDDNPYFALTVGGYMEQVIEHDEENEEQIVMPMAGSSFVLGIDFRHERYEAYDWEILKDTEVRCYAKVIVEYDDESEDHLYFILPRMPMNLYPWAQIWPAWWRMRQEIGLRDDEGITKIEKITVRVEHNSDPHGEELWVDNIILRHGDLEVDEYLEHIAADYSATGIEFTYGQKYVVEPLIVAHLQGDDVDGVLDAYDFHLISEHVKDENENYVGAKVVPQGLDVPSELSGIKIVVYALCREVVTED